MKKKEIKNIGRILALLGAILCLVYGILYILQTPVAFASVYIFAGLGYLVYGIILIVLAAIILASYGVIHLSVKFKVGWVMILIVGLIAYFFGGDIGAILLIIAAIVYLIAEL